MVVNYDVASLCFVQRSITEIYFLEAGRYFFWFCAENTGSYRKLLIIRSCRVISTRCFILHFLFLGREIVQIILYMYTKCRVQFLTVL